VRFNEAAVRSLLDDWTLRSQIRVTPLAYRATPLGLGYGKTRLASPDHSFRVLYVAPALITSVAETIVRDRFDDRVRRALTREEMDLWGATEVSTRRPVRLLDLRGMGPTLLGIPTDALMARNHAAGRRLSRSLYNQFADIDGVVYTSRHVKKDCVAIYDRAVPKLRAGPVEPLITLPALAPALIDLDIRLIGPKPA
jgi:hypothetical protein